MAPVEDSVPKVRTGGGHREEHRVQPQPYAVTCEHLDTTVGTGLLGHGLGLEEGEEEIVIRPADRLVATMRCPDPFNPGEHWHPPFDLQARGTGADPAVMGAAPLDAVLDLPTGAIGAGKIVERVEMNPTQTDPAACPAQDPTGYTTACTISWTGEVETVRSDHVRETPSVGLRFDPRSRRLTLTVRCAAACRGLLNVSLRGAAGGRHVLQVPYRAKGSAPALITRRLGRRAVPAGTTSSGLRVRSVPL